MKPHTMLWVMLLLLAACAPQPQAVPTLAMFPTATPIPDIATPLTRATLPPTFTPTAPPTNTPLPATETPPPALNLLPTSAIGDPLRQPENFPIRVNVFGSGCTLEAAPPPAVSYVDDGDTYTLTLGYNSAERENLAVTLVIRAGAILNDDPLPVCVDGERLTGGAWVCLHGVYIDGGSFAEYVQGGTVTVQSLEPLSLTVDAPFALGQIPNTPSRCNTAPRLTVNVDGQALTVR